MASTECSVNSVDEVYDKKKINSEMRKDRLKSIIIFTLSLALSVVLFKTVLFLGYVPTESMVPTLKEKSFCLGLRVGTTYEVGDIVTFHHDGIVMLKRIAAKGGETYECDGKTYKIPDGCYFMRGDNVDNSFDSRYWDEPYVTEDDIIAEIILPQG